MGNDFINTTDIGKLVGVCHDIKSYRHYREKTIKPSLDIVPPEYVSLVADALPPHPGFMYEFAKRNNMPEMSLNIVNQILYKAALEHDDINKDLRDIFTKIILYYGNEIQTSRDLLKNRANVQNARRDVVIKANELKLKNAEFNSTAFVKKIEESEKLLEIRKRKFIRAFNKALSIAGVPQKLSSSDYKVYEILLTVNWVGFDGSIHCCIEQNIMDADVETSREIFKEILEMLRGNS